MILFSFVMVRVRFINKASKGATIWLVTLALQARVQLYGWLHLLCQGATIWLAPLALQARCNYVAGSTWLPSQGATIWLVSLGRQARVHY